VLTLQKQLAPHLPGRSLVAACHSGLNFTAQLLRLARLVVEQP
jgi:hypothetical protein